MQLRDTDLPGVVEMVPTRHGDARGWFAEIWNRDAWASFGITIEWVQDNESLSAPVGTVRGIHFQRDPAAQDKLVRVISGRILDIAVDLRASSPTFGRHVAIELSAETGNQLLIPRGFGHGFATLEPDCHVAYKVSSTYSPEHDSGIAWHDPALGIDWPFSIDDAVTSDKDMAAPTLADAAHLLFD